MPESISHSFKKEMTYVGDSKIHGKGLFAKKTIKKGQLIGYVEGKYTKKNGGHVLWVDEGQGFEVSCCLRYINHSNKPNASYYNDLSVVALKTINKGEEITHNYGSEWD